MKIHPYQHLRAALATMHGKGEAIAPPMSDRLGLVVETAEGLDTDALGTFSGEIERVGTMGEVAIRKARLGMAVTGLKRGLASEGTFGPHPHFPFVPAGMELLVLVDDELGTTITESLIVDRTNCAETTADRLEALDAFLDRALFPSHGLIVKPSKRRWRLPFRRPAGPVFKGITGRDELADAIRACARVSADGLALIQTDMRAHLNPTRMASLRVLADRLAGRLLCLCQSCGAPGYGTIGVERGLPCQRCGLPTDLVIREMWGCAACGLRETRERADALFVADPAYCPICNP